MPKSRPKTRTEAVGPGRWNFREYVILERPSPRGRKYDIQTPAKQLVATCRVKRAEDGLTFYADPDEATELMVFRPKEVRQYASAFEVVDGPTGKIIGEFRKKVYRPLNKTEWFIVDPDGEPLGMVTEAARGSTWVTHVLPIPRLRPKSYEVHWGQTVGGRITRRLTILGMDQLEVDLSLDKKDAIDRRLALGVAVLVRDDDRNGSNKA